MIPFRADRPAGFIPVTFGLSAVLILVYAWQTSLGDQASSLIANGGLVPARVSSITSWSVVGPGGQLMSLVTHMFLHEGWMHVLTNVWWLLLFGGAVELAMGRLQFTLFFLVAGILSGAGYALTHSESIRALIGASGAISAVVGAYVCVQPRARVSTLLLPIPVRAQIHAWIYIVLWLLLQTIFILLTQNREPSVAFWAHIIGFTFGFSWSWLRLRGSAQLSGEVVSGAGHVQPFIGGEAQ